LKSKEFFNNISANLQYKLPSKHTQLPNPKTFISHSKAEKQIENVPHFKPGHK
jgi:hypothetical protein